MSNWPVKPETIAAHALKAIDEATGAVSPPIYLAATYARDTDYKPRIAEDYQRNGSPTLWQAEAVVAALEQGADAMLYASGLAAVVGLFETVPAGAHVVAPKIMYYGTRAWLQRLEKLGRITLTLVESVEPGAIEAAIRPGITDMVWIETPVNPTWSIYDIAAIAGAAHAAGARLAVDATVTGAVTTRPLTLGADYVFHSATKYLNGHSDVLAGALVTRADDARWAEAKLLRTRMGSPLAPYECWLLMRGMRTLFVRYRQSSANALAIARHFENHARIERVLYPGLPGHPGHAIAARQMVDGYSGMLSLLIRGDFDDAKHVCTRLKVIVPATSLGGVESLAEHRKTVEGPDSPLADNLVRFSIGIENTDDLIADIEQALG